MEISIKTFSCIIADFVLAPNMKIMESKSPYLILSVNEI